VNDDKSQLDIPRRARPFQFSLLTIFILLTVCAAVAAVIRAIPLPPFARYFAAIYLMILGVPLLLRMPSTVRAWWTYSARMRQLDEERDRLLESARQRQQHGRGESTEGGTVED
jgi:hypothetical protein